MFSNHTLPTCPYHYLTVVGCGLIGGSLVLAARQMYPELYITAVDTHSETLQTLLSTVNHVSLTLPERLESNHLVVLATHLSSNQAYLEQLAPLVAADETITLTDIGSCKQAICAQAACLLPGGQFIGGHPLAGKELSGVSHATGLLFAGKPYVLCPPAGQHEAPSRLMALKQFVEEGLRAHVGFQTPEHHDWAMAYVSHLPQLYAVLLTNLLAQNRPGELLGFHGAGMDGQLRLAASPFAMWQDIFRQNQKHIREAIRGCKVLLEEAEIHLTDEALADWFGQQFATANWIHQEFHAVRRQDAPVVLDDQRSSSL